jgi:hypothetical protein
MEVLELPAAWIPILFTDYLQLAAQHLTCLGKGHTLTDHHLNKAVYFFRAKQ